MEIEPERSRNNRSTVRAATRWLQVALGLLLLTHFIQIFSPMRLDLDATSYLSRTVELVEGTSLGPTWHPPGYSYALAGLDLLGIGNAWTFAGLNWLFLVLGIGASYYVLRNELGLSENAALVISCMTLLSFVFVKYVPMPLADTVFFGLSMGVLALLARFRMGSRHAVLLLMLAVILSVAAMLTRTIGITLAAGLLTTGWIQFVQWHRAHDLTAREHRTVMISAIVGLLLLGCATTFFLASRYLAETAEVGAILGFDQMVLNTILARVRNWGQLFFNVPRSIVPDLVEFLYIPATVIGLWIIVRGYRDNRTRWGSSEAYFALYILALLIYPGPQTRYWLPVVPLMLGWGFIGLRPFWKQRWGGALVAAYLVGYVITGIVAVAYSSTITFSGGAVGQTYGDGTLRPAYAAAYDSARGHAPFETPLQEKAFLLLLRYDPQVPTRR